MRGVINAQIEALEQDDAETAFSYASPALRKMFQTPRQFISMIRQNYAAVYRPRAITFLPPSIVHNVPVQPVRLLASDGKVIVALYSMQREEISMQGEKAADGGKWRINGCQLVPLNAVYAVIQAEHYDPIPDSLQARFSGAFLFARG
ncbi:MAG: DUF4864 domain-containing protein [Burkholderiales bacterium]|nr:DUF4864 domain-containing protein [Burkholderiales bacterium]